MIGRPISRPVSSADLIRNIGRLRAGGGTSTDADAAAWAAAVTANSGTYSAATLAELSKFIKAAKAAGYWDKLYCFNPMAGVGLSACLIQKTGTSWAAATNVNFVSGDYSESTGLTGNGSSKYLKTGMVPSTVLTLNDTHLAVYNRASSATGGGATLGSFDASANILRAFLPNAAGNAVDDNYNTASLSVAVTASYGLMVVTETGATARAIYKGGSSIGTSTATHGSSMSSAEVYVFCQNANGTASSFISHPLATYSIGKGLTDADVAAYNTHMQAFQTALGRNV